MDPISTAALTLGTQVVKSACRLWLGDGFAGSMSDAVADLLKDQVPDAIQRSKLKRMFDGFAETVAERARRAGDRQWQRLPENEREAAILNVAETFEKATLTDAVLFAVNLDARLLETHLRRYVTGRLAAWGMSEQGSQYYDYLLRECCSYLLEIKKTLPPFTSEALTELLRRSSAIEQQLADVLERLPARQSMTGDDGFETDYRRQVAHELDYMNMFGASVFERNRGYRLSIAYISLLVADGTATAADQFQGVAVESVLAESSRVFFRGEAGSGKTTLLQWLAVSAARREFSAELSAWNDLVPFFIRLRQLADVARLPGPEDFLQAGAAEMLAAVMPDGWVHRILRDGRGIVLIDGVDEVPTGQREQILEWLRVLIATFPESRFVVTSRPAAAAEDWLRLQDFRACFVQPMTLPDIRRFIAHWHEAMAQTLVESAAKEQLTRLSAALVEKIYATRHLRLLATNPLMCALLCALNRDRRAQLPENRIELYRISLEMFLQRRDSERGMKSASGQMDFPDKLRLLQDLAYWMMTNDLAAAERDRVEGRLDAQLETRRHRIAGNAHEVLTHLLERSGVLREPVSGWIDFIHRSFQEFLAAQAAVDRDDIESLVARAADVQWRQVVILAAGLGTKRQTDRIFHGLLNPPRRLRRHKVLLELSALGCMETATEVEPAIRHRIRSTTESLVPPRNQDQVEMLSRVGDYAFELLADAKLDDLDAAQYTAELATRLGGPAGLRLLERITRSLGPENVSDDFASLLRRSWPAFDPIEYADSVLAHIDTTVLHAGDAKVIPGLVRLAGISTVGCGFGQHDDFTFLQHMVDLDSAIIWLPSPPNPGGISVAVPATLTELTLRLDASGPSQEIVHELYDHPERSLMVCDLDSVKILGTLRMTDIMPRLVIARDAALTDLRGFPIPAESEFLEIVDCPNFISLHGVADLVGVDLSEIRVVRPHPEFRVTASIADLLRLSGPGVASPVVHLNRLEIWCPLPEHSKGGGMVDFRFLGDIGFEVTVEDQDGWTVLSAVRRWPPLRRML